MYIKRIIIKKNSAQINWPNLYFIEKSTTFFSPIDGVCQKITKVYVQVSSTPNVKSRAFPCIYRYHDIYLSEPNMLETCTGMECVIGYISELRKKCTWIHRSVHAGIF